MRHGKDKSRLRLSEMSALERPTGEKGRAMNERMSNPSDPIEAGGDFVPEYSIEAQTSLVERSLKSLKHGDAFAVLDSYGDLGTIPDSPEGLFYRDTRHLSRFELRIE